MSTMEVGSDELYHSLEQRHITLLKEHQNLMMDNQTLQGKLVTLQSTIDQMNSAKEDMKREQELIVADNKQKEYVIKEIDRAAEELRNRNSRLADESMRCREDLKTVTTELATSQERLHEAMNKSSEAEEKLLPMHYEITKLTRERELLIDQNKWFELELSTKSTELLKVRKETNQKVNALESSLVQIEGQCAAQTDTIQSLQDRLANNAEKMDWYTSRIAALESAAATEQLNFGVEMEAQRKLVDLYKRYFDEATTKIEEQELALKASKEAHAAVVAQLNGKLKAAAEQADAAFSKLKDEAAATISELEQKLAQQQSVARVEMIGEASTGDVLASLSVTEMYDKVVAAKRELNIERSKRREAELYLARIFKDVESKTPVIISQRREFHRLVEAHSQLTAELDDVIVQVSQLKASLHLESTRARTAERDLALANQQTADLSAQVQHLLRNMMQQSYGGQQQRVALIAYDESSSSAADVISDRLVTFDDIAELQSRNQQLLQVVRKLSEEQESAADVERDGGDVQVALQQAMQELQSMREARQRTEDMVKSLVQQRDMYRAIAEEGDLSAAPRVSDRESSTASREAEMRVVRLEEENKRVLDRCARLEEAEKTVSEALDKTKAEALTLRLEAAHATSDATFQKERCERLEEALKGARADVEAAMVKRSELQALLVTFQQESRGKGDVILQHQEELRAAQESLRRLQIDCEVTKKSEERLVSQIAELKEDFKKQSSIGDSIRKIEQGLLGQKEEELLSVARERDSLLKTVEALRKEVTDNSVLSEQRVAGLEGELRTLRTRVEAKTEECAAVKEDLARDQAALVSARERSALLERQLNRAHELLSSSQGAHVLEAVTASQVSQSEVALEKAQAEVEALTTRLATAEEHMEQYKRISATNEGLVGEMRQKFQSTKALIESEMQRMGSELEAARAEVSERRTESMRSLQEAEEARNQLQEYIKAQSDSVRAQAEAVSAAENKSSVLAAQVEVLKEDVAKFQLMASDAQTNYRREVVMHSKATEDLLQLQKQLDASKTEVVALAATAADLTAKALRLENALDDERKTHQTLAQSHLAKIADLQATNDLLHNQVQTLGNQITRFQETRSVLPDAAAAPTGATELHTLQLASTELRELIRFMKREQDVVQAKLNIAENENNRLKMYNNNLQKALDEAKAELSKELEHRVVSRGEEEFTRLMAEVAQLNMIRESNNHLRAENEEFVRRVQCLTADLAAAREKEAPMMDQLRVLAADKSALESERASLSTDVAYWKDRLHQLVSRYNEVDPEEHRILQSKFEETQSRVTSLEASLAESVKEVEALRVRETELSNELENHRRLLTNEQQSSEKLRTGIRQMKEKVNNTQTTQQNTIASLQKQVADGVALLEEAQRARRTAETALAAAEEAKNAALAAKASSEAALAEHLAKPTTAKKDIVCTNFLKGDCRFGANCHYKHELPAAATMPAVATVAEPVAIIAEPTTEPAGVTAPAEPDAEESGPTKAQKNAMEIRRAMLEKKRLRELAEAQQATESAMVVEEFQAPLEESTEDAPGPFTSSLVEPPVVVDLTEEVRSPVKMIVVEEGTQAKETPVAEEPDVMEESAQELPVVEPVESTPTVASSLNADAAAFVPTDAVVPRVASAASSRLQQRQLRFGGAAATAEVAKSAGAPNKKRKSRVVPTPESDAVAAAVQDEQPAKMSKTEGSSVVTDEVPPVEEPSKVSGNVEEGEEE